jgi:hypothetical protein
MYGYEINVSKNGKHYFATHERSLINKETAESVYKDFLTRFPMSEGFLVSITYRTGESLGCELDENENLIIKK